MKHDVLYFYKLKPAITGKFDDSHFSAKFKKIILIRILKLY